MDAQETEAIKQLTELRKRILDLSKRNALLNFRHQAKSKQHLRIIDEVLSKTFNDLVAQKRFLFDPLFEPTKPTFRSKANEQQVELGDTVVYTLARSPDQLETVTIVDHPIPPGATEFAKKESPIGYTLIGMKVGDRKFTTLPSGGTTIELHEITKKSSKQKTMKNPN